MKGDSKTLETKAFLMFITSMFIYGTIGIFRRYIPIGSATLAMLRGITGVIILLGVKLLGRKKTDFSAIKRNGFPLVISGFFIGANWLALFEAYNHTSVAIATLCYYMAPVFVIIVSPFILKEKLSVQKVVCVGVSLVGMLLISGVLKPQAEETSFLGIFLALVAAVLYTCVILVNKSIHNIDSYDKTILQLAASAVILVPYVLFKEKPDFSGLSVQTFIMIAIVGIVHTGIAYALYFGSIEHLPTQRVAVFSYIDPIVAVILSNFLLAERMGAMEIAGTLCILCAAIGSEIKIQGKKFT